VLWEVTFRACCHLLSLFISSFLLGTMVIKGRKHLCDC
jgi:hypothetical protein